MKKVFYTVLTIAVMGLPVMAYFLFKNKELITGKEYTTIQFIDDKPREMVPGSQFSVLSCKVYDGMSLNVTLDTRQSIDIKLKSFTKEEAGSEIVNVLKTAGSPTVILRRKIDNYWIVDFNLTIDGKKTTLLEWLSSKNLLL